MNNPQLYVKINDLQKRDAADTLQEWTPLLPWGKKETVLDVGCGPGDVTTTLLFSYLPEDVKIVGCDISEEMIKFAEMKYGSDRFKFKQLDIGNANIWMNWEEEAFDKIFSFYCLHWIKDQRQATLNMNGLLKRNGYMCAMFTTVHPFFQLLDNVKNDPKWKPYTRIWNPWDVINTGKDPKTEYENLLKDCGFDIISCTTREVNFVHESLDEFIFYFDSVNPFKKRISGKLAKEFLNDVATILLENGWLKRLPSGEVCHEYTVMTTIAKKITHVVS